MSTKSDAPSREQIRNELNEELENKKKELSRLSEKL